jgi:ubiquinone/menaquinone biosynthesis C-methylase UbiE
LKRLAKSELNIMATKKSPAVIDYEGSDYQTRFWEKGGREYEDLCEAIALKRLLPTEGRLILELGAGAGRNTPRYHGFERVVLLDYSRTQLIQAQQRLGTSERYIYVAADIYRLPFVQSLFNTATMIRTLHHMADAPAALHQVRNVLQPGGTFILEYANKRNLKAIFRYALHLQTWSPFTPEPLEFAPLNFDFHPNSVRRWLSEADFHVEETLAVSHFRVEMLKRNIPASILAGFDSIFQWTGRLWQFTPSVFIRARVETGENPKPIPENPVDFFKCPQCGHAPLTDLGKELSCDECSHVWKITEGIFDFRGEES